MKTLLPILLLALTSACSRSEASAADAKPPQPTGSPAGVRVDVQSKAKLEGSENEIAVRFHVANGAKRDVAYQGYSEDMPTYSVEFEEGGGWSPYSVGFCGTGLLDFNLQPGAEMSFQVVIPADGKTYRAKFGDPLVVTPPVVAEAR